MERAEWLRARSWVGVARKREATGLRLVADARKDATGMGNPALWGAQEYQENANSAWMDAIVALLRALTQP